MDEERSVLRWNECVVVEIFQPSGLKSIGGIDSFQRIQFEHSIEQIQSRFSKAGRKREAPKERERESNALLKFFT